MSKIRLGVNIDHVATVRNARGEQYPSPLRAALDAELYGADGITAHLREDRRHIVDKDIDDLVINLKIPLNLEMAATEEMLLIALKHKPNACCIVPEKRAEITTEGGIDTIKNFKIYNYYSDHLMELLSIRELILDDLDRTYIELMLEGDEKVLERVFIIMIRKVEFQKLKNMIWLGKEKNIKIKFLLYFIRMNMIKLNT